MGKKGKVGIYNDTGREGKYNGRVEKGSTLIWVK